MALSKISLMSCLHCGGKLMIRPADVERGFIVCTHTGCGSTNPLAQSVEYDQRLALDLPTHGLLVYQSDPAVVLRLRFGQNVIGTGEGSTGRVARYEHRGRCYISRRHCTLTVAFDPWAGTLRYQLQDGATDPADRQHKSSLNGTYLNGARLQAQELIDMGHHDLVSLGGADVFRLEQATIDPLLRETYKITRDFNADATQ
jgi:pSer/pThr/pTyr-binding forkhead associated (FHA) protein